MAKYAQGYARKNSDTKNLIILISSIVAVIVLAVALVFVVNKVKKPAANFSSEKYAEYYISDYRNIESLNADDTYYVYFCSKDSDDANMTAVLKYIDKNNSKDGAVKLYLVDFDALSEDKHTADLFDDFEHTVQKSELIKVVNGYCEKSSQVNLDVAKELK